MACDEKCDCEPTGPKPSNPTQTDLQRYEDEFVSVKKRIDQLDQSRSELYKNALRLEGIVAYLRSLEKTKAVPEVNG